MHRHGRNDTSARKKLLHQRLLCEVVDADVVLGGHEEPRLRWVERDTRHTATVLAEGILARLFRKLVHDDTARGAVGRDRGKVVPPATATTINTCLSRLVSAHHVIGGSEKQDTRHTARILPE